MKRKTWRIGFSVSSPVALLRQHTLSQLFFPVAVQGNDLGSGQDLDIVDRLDAVDEILRHVFCETWPTHQHPDFCSEVAQEDGGLARRVAAADQNDLLVSTQARLDGRSPVPDSASLEIPKVKCGVGRSERSNMISST
jgi:hypothetical protein